MNALDLLLIGIVTHKSLETKRKPKVSLHSYIVVSKVIRCIQSFTVNLECNKINYLFSTFLSFSTFSTLPLLPLLFSINSLTINVTKNFKLAQEIEI